MKKIISLLLVIALLLCNGISVLSEEISTPPADQISSDLNFASDSKTFLTNGTHSRDDDFAIVYIYSGIAKASSSSVAVFATTTANQSCSTIGGISIVQRWYSNEWQTYDSFSFEDYVVSTVTDIRTISVESGYYYRVTTIHLAISADATYESAFTTTKSIYVN